MRYREREASAAYFPAWQAGFAPEVYNLAARLALEKEWGITETIRTALELLDATLHDSEHGTGRSRGDDRVGMDLAMKIADDGPIDESCIGDRLRCRMAVMNQRLREASDAYWPPRLDPELHELAGRLAREKGWRITETMRDALALLTEEQIQDAIATPHDSE